MARDYKPRKSILRKQDIFNENRVDKTIHHKTRKSLLGIRLIAEYPD